MPVLTIYICNKPYQLACDEGQEHHLTELAQEFDISVRKIVNQAGQIPEQLAFLMASLTLADELGELKREVELLRRQVAQYEKESKLRKVSKKAANAGTHDLLEQLTGQVEQLSAKLK